MLTMIGPPSLNHTLNSFGVHPQATHTGHLMDDVLMVVGSLRLYMVRVS
jgi:hypothetical protein